MSLLKPLTDMNDMLALTIQQLDYANYFHTAYDQEEIDLTQLSHEQMSMVIKTMSVFLRRRKTMNALPQSVIDDYKSHYLVLTTHGYQLHGNFNQYVSLNFPDDIIDYDDAEYQIAHYLVTLEVNYQVDDTFAKTNADQLHLTFLQKVQNHFQDKNIPVKFNLLADFNDQNYQQLQQAAFDKKMQSANWSQRLYAYVWFVTRQNQHLAKGSDMIMMVSLFTAAYIRQHHNNYQGIDVDDDQEYSPNRSEHNSYIWSSSKEFKWPNRWFTLAKERMNWFDNQLKIDNISIDHLNDRYPHAILFGNDDNEFRPYTKIIEQYLSLQRFTFDDLLNDHYYRIDELDKKDKIAIDWDDLKQMRLPKLTNPKLQASNQHPQIEFKS